MSLNGKFKSHSQFTSPLHINLTSRKEKSIEDLKAQLSELDKDIAVLQTEGLKEGELNIHIEKLHEYNRLKDVGQAVLGQLGSNTERSTDSRHLQVLSAEFG